jgi:hypothetical protein
MLSREVTVSRVQQVALLLVAAVAVVGAGAALAMLAGRTGSASQSPPAEAAPPETMTVAATQTSSVPGSASGDATAQIDRVSSQTVQTYGSCQAGVDALVARAQAYAGSAQSFTALGKKAMAAQTACVQAASSIADHAGDAATTGSTQLGLALAQYARLAQAQAGGASQLVQALGASSQQKAAALATGYVSFVGSLDGQAKAATASLEQARTQAGLPPKPA